MSEYIQIITTVDEKEYAKRISDELVKERLAACVQIIGPIESTYRWEGNVEHSQEFICLIKTKRIKFKEVEKTIKHIHPYENPEIISVPIVNGSKEYLNWIEEVFE